MQSCCIGCCHYDSVNDCCTRVSIKDGKTVGVCWMEEEY